MMDGLAIEAALRPSMEKHTESGGSFSLVSLNLIEIVRENLIMVKR